MIPTIGKSSVQRNTAQKNGAWIGWASVPLWGAIALFSSAQAATLYMTVANCANAGCSGGQILSLDTVTHATAAIVNKIPTRPDSLILDSAGRIIYTIYKYPSTAQGELHIFDPQIGDKLLASGFSSQLVDLTLDPGGNTVTVSDAGNAQLVRVSLSTGAKTTLPFFAAPDGIAYDNNQNLYVNFDNDGFSNVARINPATGATITQGSGMPAFFDGLTYDSTTNKLWAADATANCIRSFDLATLTPSSCAPGSLFPVGSPDGIESDGAGNLYIAVPTVNNTSGSVYRYSISGQTLTQIYSSSTNIPHDIAPAAATPTPLTISCAANPSNTTVATATSVTTSLTQGTAYSLICTASGGTPAYQWLLSQSLPSWLSATSSSSPTFIISGNAATSTSFIVFLQDSTGPCGSQCVGVTVTINVNAVLTIGCSPPTATAGIGYSGNCAATGGNGSYTFTTATSSPAGFSLDRGGNITGTSTTAGVYSINVAAMDGSTPPITGSTTFQITVLVAALTISSCTGAISTTVGGQPGFQISLAAGVSYTGVCTPSGGNPLYGWTPATSTPPGFSIDKNGNLTGNASSGGSYTISLILHDSSFPAGTATAPLVFVVTAPITVAPVVTAPVGGLSSTPVVTVSSPVPSAVTGVLTIVGFIQAPGITGLPSGVTIDPVVQFSPNLGSSVSFIIPANCTGAVLSGTNTGCTGAALPAINTGTVAGTLTLQITSLTQGGISVLPTSLPTTQVSIAAAPPVAQGVNVTVTSTSIAVDILGYSNTRDLTNAVITFHAGGGLTLTGAETPMTVSLNSQAASFFSTSTHGSFEVVITFGFTGNTAAVGSVDVVFTNSVGKSVSVNGHP